SVALISVVPALDTSQSADPVNAQPGGHQTRLSPARGTPRRSRRGDPVAGVQRPQPQALGPRWSSPPRKRGRGRTEAWIATFRRGAFSKYFFRVARTRASGATERSGSANSRPVTFS